MLCFIPSPCSTFPSRQIGEKTLALLFLQLPPPPNLLPFFFFAERKSQENFSFVRSTKADTPEIAVLSMSSSECVDGTAVAPGPSSLNYGARAGQEPRRHRVLLPGPRRRTLTAVTSLPLPRRHFGGHRCAHLRCLQTASSSTAPWSSTGHTGVSVDARVRQMMSS
nr:uncharacterized protein LOC127312911 [Lolium perenne]